MTVQDQRPILVYGATGAQGGPVVRELLRAGGRVRAVVRDPARAGSLVAAGVEVVRGDLNDRESLVAASRDVRAAFLHLPIINDPALGERYATNALAALEAADVPLLIFSTSGPVPDSPTTLGGLEFKRAIEQRVRAGALPAVILKPTVFMENLIAPWSLPAIVEGGVLAYPQPETQRAAWVTHDDVAAAVAGAIERPELAGRTFRLGGPAALTGPELAAGFAAALGQPVRYVALAPEEFGAGLRPVLGDAAADEVAATYRWFAASGADLLRVDDLAATAATLGYTPTPLDQWLRRQELRTAAIAG